MSVRDYNADDLEFEKELNKQFKQLQVELLKVEIELKRAELEKLHKM